MVGIAAPYSWMAPSEAGAVPGIRFGISVEWPRIKGVSQLVFLAERQAELWPHLWTWRNDSGVQTSSQEKEASGKEGEGDEEMWFLSGKQVPPRFRVTGLLLAPTVGELPVGGPLSTQSCCFVNTWSCWTPRLLEWQAWAALGFLAEKSHLAVDSGSAVNVIQLWPSSSSHFRFYNFLEDIPISSSANKYSQSPSCL